MGAAEFKRSGAGVSPVQPSGISIRLIEEALISEGQVRCLVSPAVAARIELPARRSKPAAAYSRVVMAGCSFDYRVCISVIACAIPSGLDFYKARGDCWLRDVVGPLVHYPESADSMLEKKRRMIPSPPVRVFTINESRYRRSLLYGYIAKDRGTLFPACSGRRVCVVADECDALEYSDFRFSFKLGNVTVYIGHLVLLELGRREKAASTMFSRAQA